ncbi:MAG TPA: hypothetical protein VK808_11575 [Bacteroidia bacterium]|jgi:hypothetical protein|nr:hypothetical protein [Bacteroidia bacterium]
MQEIGQQYSKDDLTGRSGFLRRARLHQSKYRAEILNLPYDKFGNYLTKEDGERGKNFYEGFGIFDAVKDYRNYNKPLYSNMLRSEHIPFNFFVPFNRSNESKVFCKNVFNEFLDNTIHTVNKIIIEYAPPIKENYLNDGTSFDAYIEYTQIDGHNGIIGIEVKYTEKEYALKAYSKQENEIKDRSSKYFTVTETCRIYKPNSIDLLITDNFRQVWRNHILGESILIQDKDKFKYFTSLTMFPQDNIHFEKVSKEYIDLLVENTNKFIPLTYEDFLAACYKHCKVENYKHWLDYLTNRYIVKN